MSHLYYVQTKYEYFIFYVIILFIKCYNKGDKSLFTSAVLGKIIVPSQITTLNNRKHPKNNRSNRNSYKYFRTKRSEVKKCEIAARRSLAL
jgi:hypothetical protein